MESKEKETTDQETPKTSEPDQKRSQVAQFDGKQDDVRIGIAGITPDQAVRYGKLFNEGGFFPGVEVRYLWTAEERLMSDIAKEAKIKDTVKDPQEMLGKVNALILGHEYQEYFLDVAAPFLKEGIPVFIQAPFCQKLEEGKEFLQFTRLTGTPVASYSPVAHNELTYSLKKQVEAFGKINQVLGYGPADLYAEHGDMYDHVIHMVQSLMLIFGDDIEYVRVSSAGKKGSANLIFRNGLFATLIFRRWPSKWQLFVDTEDEFAEVISYARRNQAGIYYSDMVEMFRSGREPLSHKSILRCVAVLEALERSIHTQNWEEVRD